jgi:hypothetical protein
MHIQKKRKIRKLMDKYFKPDGLAEWNRPNEKELAVHMIRRRRNPKESTWHYDIDKEYVIEKIEAIIKNK